MGDEVLVVDSESTARAIVAQRKKQAEVMELEKQVCVLTAVLLLMCVAKQHEARSFVPLAIKSPFCVWSFHHTVRPLRTFAFAFGGIRAMVCAP